MIAKKNILLLAVTLTMTSAFATAEATLPCTAGTDAAALLLPHTAYTDISLGMAGKERRDQEAWEREKERHNKEYKNEREERRARDKWDRERFTWEQKYDRLFTGFGRTLR